MEKPRGTRKSRDEQSRIILLVALTGLLLLIIVVVTVASLNPYDNADLRRGADQPTTDRLPPVKPALRPQPAPSLVPTAPSAAIPTTDTAAVKTVPESMATLPAGTRQIIVVTGKKLGSNSGTLSVYNQDNGRWVSVMDSVTANFGKNGLIDGEKRRTGNLETPTGIWTIGDFVFGLRPSAPPGTRMPYRPIGSDSYWSSERDSTYNTWVDRRVNGEHLIESDPQYEYAFNTGYNSPPNERVLGRGTAIFIHCFEPPDNALGRYTHGCVAISRENMERLFAILDPGRRPMCAIGTLEEGSPTSIWAY